MKIGVLALQGDFAEHLAMLRSLDSEPREVRLPAQLEGLDGLIIPGGESTTIGKLAEAYGLIEPIRQFATSRPIWGTCAGAIFLSRDAQRRQPLLGLMDITVERNAFGRQVESFEADIEVAGIDDAQRPFHAIFIRAPLIVRTGAEVSVLASITAEHDGASPRVVAARQGRLLATSFHPELTGDTRIHRYFLGMADA
jgi:5'-phosphate synthase pdxT subunit